MRRGMVLLVGLGLGTSLALRERLLLVSSMPEGLGVLRGGVLVMGELRRMGVLMGA